MFCPAPLFYYTIDFTLFRHDLILYTWVHVLKISFFFADMLSVKASSHDRTILWLYNIFCLLFSFLMTFCYKVPNLATRFAFIMASVSPMYLYYIFCIFSYLYIVRLWDENK